MKVIVAGSREGFDTAEAYRLLEEAMDEHFPNCTEVVSGTARGIDRLGERWADDHGIHINQFPADWNRYYKRAGYIRNTEMARHADGLLALWNGKSRGTRHMIEVAREYGLDVHVINLAE